MRDANLCEVDLSSRTVSVRKIPPQIQRHILGGSGLGAWILWNELKPKAEALGPHNILMFLTGPYTGTRVPCSGRTSVAAKSPLTGIWCESDVGGKFGEYCKSTGFDGIIIRGRSSAPVILRVADSEVSILNGADLWGRDTYDTHDLLVSRESLPASTMIIGEAGEKQVLLSSIVSDGSDARIAARGGLGAVMGSKQLKAVTAVKGICTAEVKSPEKLKESVKSAVKKIASLSEEMHLYGTSGGVEACHDLGDFPCRNWKDREWKEAGFLSGARMAESILSGKYNCARCPVGCGRIVKVDRGKYTTERAAGGPEYETMGSLGGNLLVSDLKAVAKANDLCNRFGIDTISVGQVLGFLFESYEKGYISDEQISGSSDRGSRTVPRPLWGSGEALVHFTRMIGESQGIGRVLGKGIRRAMFELSINDPELNLHVKGMELPSHDPRAFVSIALGYATSPRGACHLQAYSHGLEAWNALPDLGFPEILDRFTLDRKAELTVKMQNLMSVFDSLKTCKFLLSLGVTPGGITDWLNSITGWEYSLEDLLETGNRIFNLKRLINLREGITAADDTLPDRVCTGPGGRSLNSLLQEYYSLRGWTSRGVPEKKLLARLGLCDSFYFPRD